MSEVGNPFFNSLMIAVITAAMGAVVTWLFVSRANARQAARDAVEKAERAAEVIAAGHAKLESRVAELTEKLTLVSAQVVPFSTAFQQILVAQLTHAHTPELDALMKQIGPPITLSEGDEKRMFRLLEERQKDMGDEISAEERDAAVILPYVMKRARLEQTQIAVAESMRLTLVGVPVLVGVTSTALDTALPNRDKS